MIKIKTFRQAIGKTFTGVFTFFSPFYISSLVKKKQTRWQRIQSTNIKYKLCKGQNYL